VTVLCVLYMLVPVVLVGAGFMALLAPDFVGRF
jgi:hypothetical protein